MAGVKGRSGGVRPGSGRKPRSEEQQLIEKLSPLEPIALKALEKGIKADESWAVKMFMDYFYGKPTERVQVEGNMTQEITWIRPNED